MTMKTFDPSKEWVLHEIADEAADDSDKKVTVPAREVWQLLHLWVELTTTATAGDRQLVVQIQDGSDDVVAEFRVGATQAESLTRYYLLTSGVGDMTGFRDTDHLTTPMPPLVLPGGYDIRVFDNNAVDAAADDMLIQGSALKQER